MEENKKGAIDNMRPKTAFTTGIVSGIAVMFVIGFFILLGLYLSDDDNKNSNNNGNNNVVNNANTNANNNNNGNQEINLAAVDEDEDWINGDKNADVTIVEYSDIDCPFCSRFHDTMNQVMQDYDGKVRWVYRHFPLTSLHPDAVKKAEATECVGELGGEDAFWSFLDELFIQDETLSGLPSIAASVGVNQGDFEECLNSGKYTAKVQKQSQEAQAAGGRGTPYSVVVKGDQKVAIPGALPYSSIKSVLDPLVK